MSTSDRNGDDLDEPVHLSEWDPRWPALARTVAGELARSLGQGSRIEHVGSTAVEGMRGKPIVDLMIGASDSAERELFARRLSGDGWQDMGQAGVPGRRHLRKRLGEQANVHIVLLGSPHWLNNIAIRDYLRAHPAQQSAYTALKRSIVANGGDRLLSYSDRKANFMAALLERALAWRKSVGKDR